MYKCVHCQEEQPCECYNPFRIPDTPHDFPGQKRVLRLLFDPTELSLEFVELINSTMIKSMDRLLDWLLVVGDRKPLHPPWHSHNADAAEEKRDAFFSSSQFSRPYYRTKHGGNDE